MVILATAVVVAGAATSAPISPFDQVPDSTWQANGRVRAIVYAANAVYVGGEFTQVLPPTKDGGSPVTRNHAAAFDATSGALLPWDPSPSDFVWSLDVSGSIVYLGGDFASIGGLARLHAAAVDAIKGTVLPWNPRPNARVYTVKVGPDRNIYLGGAFSRIAGRSVNLLASVTPAGAPTSWRPVVAQLSGVSCPPRCPPFVASLAFSADGSELYFGGHFGLVNGIGRNNVAAVSLATGETLAWNPDVFGTGAGKNPQQANKIWHVELGPDRAYVCGDYWSLDGFKRHANLAAVDLIRGHLIRSFDATTDGNTPLCVLRDGILYLGGHYQNVGPNSAWVFVEGQKAQLNGPGSQVRNHLAAVDATTGAIAPWNPFVNSPLGIHSMAATSILLAVGGDFTEVGKVSQQHFAQFSFDTVPPNTVIDQAPPPLTSSTTASFNFHSSEKSSSFRCALDASTFTACVSPASYSGLAEGAHKFEVAAVDTAGNIDPTPGSSTWTIEITPPSAPLG
jgi:hypothetical protein